MSFQYSLKPEQNNPSLSKLFFLSFSPQHQSPLRSVCTPASEILDHLIHFLKAMLDVHWAVLRFFALNPVPLPSLLSKGEEQVAVSVSDRYLDCGWSKVNWGRGM